MEMKIVRYTMMVLVGLLLMTACSNEDERDNVRRMPIRISIPADDIGTITRAPGDPGTYEHFKLPTHLWLYLVVNNNKVEKVLEIDNISEDMWTLEELDNNNIYTYSGELNLAFSTTPDANDIAEVYALLAAETNDDFIILSPTITEGTTTKEQLLNMTFSMTGLNPGELACNIYSTPYNKNREDGKYYGFVNDYDKEMPYVDNFMLYHVAAKLDVIWNVDDAQKNDVKLSKIELLNAKKSSCYAFKPLENSAPTDNDYTESIVLDEGQQWYGRHSFYVIPYDNTAFSAKLKLYNQDDNHVKEVDLSQPYNSAIYTPWVVAPLTITGNIP